MNLSKKTQTFIYLLISFLSFVLAGVIFVESVFKQCSGYVPGVSILAAIFFWVSTRIFLKRMDQYY